MDTVQHVQPHFNNYHLPDTSWSDLTYSVLQQRVVSQRQFSALGSVQAHVLWPKGRKLKTILRLNEPESRVRSHQYSWSVTVNASDICAILALRTYCWPFFNSSDWLCISWFLLIVQHLLRWSNLLKKNIVHNTKHIHNITNFKGLHFSQRGLVVLFTCCIDSV